MGTPWLWITFNAFVLLMLAVDLGVFHRRAHAISLGEAGAWSVVWVVVSLTFNLGILHWSGKTPALEFFTAYLIEKTLSVDNIFVFVLLFRYFAVEPRYQHRVLFWGILGALVMRGAMIALGVALIRHFEWVLYLFGAFLVYAGLKMISRKEEEIHPERNPVLRWARKFLPLTPNYEGQKFFVRNAGVAGAPAGRKPRLWHATPLIPVLLVVEATDLAFALDSIPAVFAITRDPFIVYTSNVCAILGLRAFYFLLAGVLPYFRYLGKGLSFVLMFIGVKMLGEKWLHIPTHVSLAVVGAILSVAVIASIVAAQVEERAQSRPKTEPAHPASSHHPRERRVSPIANLILELADDDPALREAAAAELSKLGAALGDVVVEGWRKDAELAALLAVEPTVGVAVWPEHFEKVRAAMGSPPLAVVPPDQDALEFEVHLAHHTHLDILTTKEPGGSGAIARFLEKFGEGIQQVEYPTTNVDRATQVLRARFGLEPIYLETLPGTEGTRVNFFLTSRPDGKKVLIELVEGPAEGPNPKANCST